MKKKINKISSMAIVGLLIFSGCLGFGDDGVTGDNLTPQAVVTITSDQKVVDLGDPIQFSASNSNDEDGSIVSYLWDFGDAQKAPANAAIPAPKARALALCLRISCPWC